MQWGFIRWIHQGYVNVEGSSVLAVSLWPSDQFKLINCSGFSQNPVNKDIKIWDNNALVKWMLWELITVIQFIEDEKSRKNIATASRIEVQRQRYHGYQGNQNISNPYCFPPPSVFLLKLRWKVGKTIFKDMSPSSVMRTETHQWTHLCLPQLTVDG